MKATIVVAWMLTVAAAFALGYRAVPPAALSPTAATPTAAPSDVAQTLAGALKERDHLLRTYRIADSLRGLSPENVEQARYVLDAQRRGVSESDVRVFMFAWSRFDPAGAFAWASADRTPWQSTLEGAAMLAWAFRDPQAALAALDRMPEPRQRVMRPHLVDGWVRSGDRQGATEYVANLPPNRERGRYFNALAAEIMIFGMDEVLAWAEAVPEDAPNDAKEACVQTALHRTAKFDIAKAVAWWEAHREFAYARTSLRPIVRRWVQYHDPNAAFEWLLALPDDDLRTEGVKAGFNRWLDSDPEAASDFLREAKANAGLDPAVAMYASERARVDARDAADMAFRIQDENLRRRTLAPILRAWARSDTQSARAWMVDHDVPEEIERAIIESPRMLVKPGGAGAEIITP